MRINEYDSIDQFLIEYDPRVKYSLKNRFDERFIGIEFKYHGAYYRMCREPLKLEELPILPDGRSGRYDVMIVHWPEDNSEPVFETIGWYADMDDLLNNCILQGKTFAEVIMADETEIVGKD